MESYTLLYATLQLIANQVENKLIKGNTDISSIELHAYFVCKSIFEFYKNHDISSLYKYKDEIINGIAELSGENWDIISEKLLSNLAIINLNEHKDLKNLDINKVDRIEVHFK